MVKQAVYRFGAYRLRPDAGLFRDGQWVRLPPKELALLHLLVQLEGDVATHKRIEETLWPGQYVSYSSLARCVYSLRRRLEHKDREWIETVPRRGYRLTVPVERIEDTVPSKLVHKAVRTVPLAHSHYLEGLHEANRGEPGAQARAIALFEEAYRVDPTYAVALGAIADCRMYQTVRGYLRPTDGERLGREACERALEIDPDLVSARATLGWFEALIRRNASGGLALVDEALELDPRYARGHSYRTWILRAAGRFDESISSARTSVALDPHSVLSKHALAWSLFCAGRAEEALVIERSVRHEVPHIELGHAHVAVVASWLGYHDEAIAAGREAARISRNNPALITALTYALANAGESDEARRLAEEAARALLPRAVRSQLAMTYVALNEPERTLDLLHEAREERCPWFPGARFDPRLGGLADDTRLRALYDEPMKPS